MVYCARQRHIPILSNPHPTQSNICPIKSYRIKSCSIYNPLQSNPVQSKSYPIQSYPIQCSTHTSPYCALSVPKRSPPFTAYTIHQLARTHEANTPKTIHTAYTAHAISSSCIHDPTKQSSLHSMHERPRIVHLLHTKHSASPSTLQSSNQSNQASTPRTKSNCYFISYTLRIQLSIHCQLGNQHTPRTKGNSYCTYCTCLCLYSLIHETINKISPITPRTCTHWPMSSTVLLS